jgi:hypothetical protein
MSLPKNTTPVAIGAAIGAIAISFLSLANGWVVTAQKQQSDMDEASVSIQASICASRAELFLKETNSTVNLQGYQTEASARREELANASPLQGADAATSTVIDACARMLNKPNV